MYVFFIKQYTVQYWLIVCVGVGVLFKLANVGIKEIRISNVIIPA